MNNKYVMIKYILRGVLMLLVSVTTAQVHEQQAHTLKSIRDVRKAFLDSSLINSPEVQDLQIKLSQYTNVVGTLTDETQLKFMESYFNSIKKVAKFDSTVAKIINQDLQSKMDLQRQDPKLLQGKFLFGLKKEITVRALIGQQLVANNKYRLYWTYYTGRSRKELISQGGEASSQLINPYKLSVLLPGLITFWLVDTSTNPPAILLSDLEFVDCDIDIKSPLDLVFKKTN
ncbi:MAG: hypothetical protein EOO51_00175 [Flavobacterium sp.]|nr:MAG: hypothetical protein EOO51_00175 [Flavobacterium sp.]